VAKLGLEGIDAVCGENKCQARSSVGEFADIDAGGESYRIDISNRLRLGYTEVQLVEHMILAANLLAAMEEQEELQQEQEQEEEVKRDVAPGSAALQGSIDAPALPPLLDPITKIKFPSIDVAHGAGNDDDLSAACNSYAASTLTAAAGADVPEYSYHHNELFMEPDMTTRSSSISSSNYSSVCGESLEGGCASTEEDGVEACPSL